MKRKLCVLYTTINFPDISFVSLKNTYIENDELKVRQNREQMNVGIIDLDSRRSDKYKILTEKFETVFESTTKKMDAEDFVSSESYCFTGEKYKKTKNLFRGDIRSDN